MSKSAGFDVKKIAIVGAGPSGLAAAKYLLAEEAFDKIDIFEQRSNVGGVWNYTAEANDQLRQVPRTDPHEPLERPLWRECNGEKEPIFVSPMYNALETNIPQTLMQFSDLDFPQGTQLFPPREVVLMYLEKYAEDIRHLIRFYTQVVDVRSQTNGGHLSWLVKTQNILTSIIEESTYDAVVIASGHYNVPYIPDIPGVQAWDRIYPGSVTHSKFYRSPDDFKDKVRLSIWVERSNSSEICVYRKLLWWAILHRVLILETRLERSASIPCSSLNVKNRTSTTVRAHIKPSFPRSFAFWKRIERSNFPMVGLRKM